MSVTVLEQLPVKIYADGADPAGIVALYKEPFIRGLTTNPTLMRKVGISDYEAFAKSVLEVVKISRSRLKFFLTTFRRCSGRRVK